MTAQHPLNSGFNAASTAAEVVEGLDLAGRRAVVTGGSSGLGLEMVRALHQAGAGVIVPARDVAAATEAFGGLPGVVVRALDLSDPSSISAFAAERVSAGEPIHMLINSAGVMATPPAWDARGHESQFSTNHLGHFELTCRLWPLLRQEGARVVSLSSRGHQIAGIDFDDIDFERRPYDKWVAYGQSKTASALFALALDRRGADLGVRAFSVHPGTILGRLARHLTEDEIAAFDVLDAGGERIVAPDRDLKTPEQGAATAVWCATSPALASLGGLYCEDCDVAPLAGDAAPGRRGVSDWACDPAAAERLWALSAAFTGIDL